MRHLLPILAARGAALGIASGHATTGNAVKFQHRCFGKLHVLVFVGDAHGVIRLPIQGSADITAMSTANRHTTKSNAAKRQLCCLRQVQVVFVQVDEFIPRSNTAQCQHCCLGQHRIVLVLNGSLSTLDQQLLLVVAARTMALQGHAPRSNSTQCQHSPVGQLQIRVLVGDCLVRRRGRGGVVFVGIHVEQRKPWSRPNWRRRYAPETEDAAVGLPGVTVVSGAGAESLLAAAALIGGVQVLRSALGQRVERRRVEN
mmetsp:Transcript_66761/g.186169  ORF Transcript_66761/g.186169 Transcript_66761/m.186169 type:complete len:257 (+) Transcript_66761:274-1044(+)